MRNYVAALGQLALSYLLVLATSTSFAADRTWSGASDNNNWTTPLNWVGGVAPVANDSLIFNSFARLTPNNNFAAGTEFDGITFAPTAGAFTLGGNSITLGGNITDNTPILTQTINLPLILGLSPDVTVADGAFLTLGGVVSGGFGINKLGDGTLTLGAANSFTASVNIADGTLRASSDANLGAVPGAATPNKIIINDGATLQSTASFTINANRGIAIGPSAGSGSGTINVDSGTTLSYGGVIANNGAGTGGLTKIRFGGLTLSGANTYTGPTKITNGTLTLDFAASTAPGDNIISTASALTLGGTNAGLGGDSFAALIMNGKAAATNMQAFNSTNIDVGLNRIVATRGAGGSATVNLGALAHNTGGHLAIGLTAANPGVVNTTTTNTNGILGGWAVIGTGTVQRGIMLGTDWASVDGSGSVVPYTGYTTALPYDPGNVAGTVLQGNVAAASNVRLPASNTLDTEVRVAPDDANVTVDINTWAWENVPTATGNGHVLTIGRGNTLRLGANGGIFRQSTANNRNFYIGSAAGGGLQTGSGVSGSQNVGNLTAGGAPNTPGEVVITVNNDSQTSGSGIIEAKIVDNGTGAVSLIKAGSGALKIDGNNTYSGGTYIIAGRLQLAGSELGITDAVNPAIGNPDGFGTGPVFVLPGGQVFASGINPDLTNTSGAGTTNNFDNITPSANDAIIANALFLAGSGTQQESLGAIRLGNRSNMTGQITLTGDARIGGGNAPTFNLNYPTRTVLTITPGNILSGKITGPFSFDLGAAASIGTDAALTNTANDWTGNTTLLGRTGGTASTTRVRLGASGVIPDGVGKGNVLFGNTLNTVSPIILDMNGFNETINGLSTAPSANVLLNFIQNDGWTATVDTSAGPNAHAYVFAATTATLTVGNYDQTATFAGIIRDNDTALTITLPNPNWNGSADPQVANGPDVDGDATTITGITNPAVTAGSKVALTKIGAGVQTLSGINTYTGATTINAGTLSVTGSLDPNQAVAVNSGGTLSGAGDGGFTGLVGNVTMAAGGSIAPGESSALGSIGTLTMSSLTVNGGDLKFNLVNPAGSDLIRVNGAANFTAASTITPNGGMAGTYTVLTSTSPITYAATPTLTAFVDPLTRPASYALDTTSTPTELKLTVTGGSKALTWTGAAGNGNWDINTTTNWTDGAIAEKFFNNDTVVFGDGPTNRTISIVGSVLPGSLEVNNSQGNDYTFTGAGSIGGSVGILKNGLGKLTVSNNNTNTGATTINSGVLELTNTGTIGSGAVTNNAVFEINRTGASTFSNLIDGAGELRHTGTGTTTLSGANTYFGSTLVSNGTVVVTNAAGGNSSLGSLFGFQVTVNPGAAIDLAGNAGGNLNFGSKQFVIAGTGVGGTGAITHSGTAAQLNAFQLVRLSANATVGGTGRFDLRGVGSNLDLGGFTLTKNGSNQFSVVGTLVSDGNIVINEGIFAIETVSSIEDSTTTDTTITYNPGTTAQFFNLTGPITRPMIFNGGNRIGNASADPSTVGSNITLAGDVEFTSLNNSTGDLTLNGNISETGGPRSVTKTGPATLLVTGTVNYTGTTDIQAGRIYVGGTLTTNNAVTVATGATLQTEGPVVVGPIDGGGTTNLLGTGTLIADHIRQGSLIVNGATAKATVRPNGGDAGASAVGTIEVESGGILDLTNNDLVIRATAATKDAVHAAAQADIVSAQNGLDANFITNWNGPGITSSAARTANLASNFDLVGLGVIRNSDIDILTGLPGSSYTTFSGQAVTPDDILVKYTYIGDGNLDGLVSFDDYVGMDNAFFGLIQNLGWATGDINFDGVINFDDYTVVDQAFFFQGAPLSGEGSGVAAVPEPSALLLAGLCGLFGLLAWRRNKGTL